MVDNQLLAAGSNDILDKQPTGTTLQAVSEEADKKQDAPSVEVPSVQTPSVEAPSEAKDALQEANPMQEKLESLRDKYIQSKAHLAALSLGVPENRIPFVIRLSDMKNVDAFSDNAEGEIQAAIKQVLSEIPEWMNERQIGTGSTGSFRRMPYQSQQQDARSQFRSGLE